MTTDFRGLDAKGLPLVSIVATCYNQERFLEETLDSIKAQTYPNIQLIITDDYSQDNSVSKIQQWIEKNNIKYEFIVHSENKGLCKTLNEALDYCSGIYYQAIACDDILLKDKIKKQVAEFDKSNEDVMVICSDALRIDEFGNKLPQIISNYNSYVGFEDFFGDFFFGVIYAGSVLIKKRVFKLVGTYDENLMSEDTDLWLRILEKYKIKYLKIDSIKYRVVKTSMSLTGYESEWFYQTAYKLFNKQVGKDFISADTIDYGFKKFIKGLYILDKKYYWFRKIIKNKFTLYASYHYLLASMGLSYNQGVQISKALGIFIPDQIFKNDIFSNKT